MPEKILIVDDDLDTLRLVGLMLQRQGYEIRAASSGTQALETLASELPDLILLDVMMPEMDGLEVTRRLRASPRTATIPIILFTAKAEVDDKVAGFEAGADAYLTKPAQPRELVANVKALLARANIGRPVTSTVARHGHLIGVLGAKGGLGVSTVVLNLGVALHQRFNEDVIVAEFRPGQGSIGLELGYTRSESLNHLVNVDPGEISANAIESELINHQSGIRLLLSSSQPSDTRLATKSAHFAALANKLHGMARYIILDLGPSMPEMNVIVLRECDQIVIVVEPIPKTVAQTRALVEGLIHCGIGEGIITFILVNRIHSSIQLSWQQVQEQLGREIAVIITPAPELAYQASLNNLPMIRQQADSLTAKQFLSFAEKIVQFK